MQIRKIAILISLIVLGKFAIAQKTDIPPNDLDKKNTPDNGSLLGSSSGNYEGRTGGTSQIKNAAKINLTLLGRSTFHLLYERGLGNYFSAEGGLGLTFSKDYVQTLFSQSGIIEEVIGDVSLSTSLSSISLYQMLQYSMYEPGPDLSASFAGKIHFSGTALDGPYLQAGVRYSAFSVRLNETYYDSYSNYYNKVAPSSQLAQIQNMNFNFLFGVQGHTEGSVKTTHEFYVGLGLRKSSYPFFSSQEIVTTDIYGNQSIEYFHSKSALRESVVAPALLFGYVFGFGF